MKQIPLTQNKFAIVDDEDFDFLSKYKWYFTNSGYACHSAKKELMHCLIMGNPIEDIDHINRNRLDNRKSNLRLATRSQNLFNRPKQKNNKSGFKGVTFDKYRLKWIAQCCLNGKLHHLGRFEWKKDAAEAYNKFVSEQVGEYAHINIREPILNKE